MHHLMCPPTYFDVVYSINPWMNVDVPIDLELARRQWDDFMLALQELGERIVIIDPQPGLPDMTFAGDGGVAFGNTFVPSNFRSPERAAEAAHYARWFEARGYQIRRLPPERSFEGLGDLLFYDGCALFGHGIRSDYDALAYIKEYLPELNILGDLRITDERYFHLALAIAFIDRHTVIYCPEAFDPQSISKIQELFRNSIALSEVDANTYFACNNLVVGNTILLDRCTSNLQSTLARLGFRVRFCPMSEFKKSGASVRCLVLSFQA